MSLLTVVKDVCAAVGVTLPTSVFSNINNNRTMVEMLALANEMAQRIAYDTIEWNYFKNTAEFIAGDEIYLPPNPKEGGFALPADYKRMLLTANVYSSAAPMLPLRFINDHDEWLSRRLCGYTDPRGEWAILGSNIFHVAPALAVGVTLYFPYLHKNCIGLASGGGGDRFLSDNDLFRVDERLLRLGMIWQWKANKGSPYAEDLGTYNDAMAIAMGNDKPAPIMIGRLPISAARRSYPFPIDPGMVPL